MRIVDTHAHAGLEKYEPVESLVDQMFRNDVEKAVLVQHMGQYNNRYLIECARRFPGRFCVCVLVDVSRPDAPERLREWAQHPEVRGIRLRCDDRSPGDNPLALWETVDELLLCVSLAGTLQGLAAPETAELAQHFRRLKLVVEHLGHPSRDEAAPYPGPAPLRFLDMFEHLGGVEGIGYPASHRVIGRDGLVYQLFQGGVLQGDPRTGEVRLANIFELLQQWGRDEDMLLRKGIPWPVPDDGARSFDEAVRVRLEWITSQSLCDRYLAPSAPDLPFYPITCDSPLLTKENVARSLELYGLPMAPPYRAGPFETLRTQRIAFQRVVGDTLSGTAQALVLDAPPSAEQVRRILGGIAAGAFTQPLPPELLLPNVLSGRAFPSWSLLPPPGPDTSVTRTASAAATATPTSAPTPQRTTPLILGFQVEGLHAPGRPQVIRLTREAGFPLLKQQVRWADLEPGRGQVDPATLAALDALIADSHQAGLQVLLSVVAAPAWAAVPGGHAPQDPAELERFLRWLLGRYRSQVQYLECWNEANLATEWGPGRLWPDGPRQYVALLAACFRAARAVDPTIQVILGALTPTGVGECQPAPDQCSPEQLAARALAIDDVQYLQALYAVQGGHVRQLFDLLGVHPGCYNNDPRWTPTTPPLAEQQRRKPAGFHGHWSFYFGRLDQLRAVLEQAGDGGKGIAITEFGCASSPQPAAGYEYARDNTPAEQAAYLVQAIELARQRPWVQLFVVWNLNYRVVVPPTDEKYAFGIVEPDWTPLPAYLALKALPK
ncbi:MAG: hypothetical protein C4289_00985 [Chloroflexota bacterium]